MNFDSSQILSYTPLLVLIAMGCIILLAETFARGQSLAGLAWLGVAACVVALIAVVVQWPDGPKRRRTSIPCWSWIGCRFTWTAPSSSPLC